MPRSRPLTAAAILAAVMLSACATQPEPADAPAPTASSDTASAPDMLPSTGAFCELIDCAARSETVYRSMLQPVDTSDVDAAIGRLADLGSVCQPTSAVLLGTTPGSGYESILERYIEAATERLAREVPEDAITVARGYTTSDTFSEPTPQEPLAMLDITLLSEHYNPDCR